jgi:fructosamine-3-kinase
MNSPQTTLNLTRSHAEWLLSAWLGAPVHCTGISPLHGGMINTVLRLDFDHPPNSAVVKLAMPGGSGFEAEARALEHLRAVTCFPSPAVYRCDDSASFLPYAFLLLEMMPGFCMAGLDLTQGEYDRIDRQLAEVLLELHSHTRTGFGTVDDVPGSARWVEVFLPVLIEVRAEPEIGQRLAPDVLADIDRAIALAAEELADSGAPTLIHGDLWSGNLLVEPSGDGWRLTGIIDPALQYADVEMELAYLEVFDTRREAFFEAYTAQRPLRPGYARRRLFYWLFTALIHVWLFGDPHYCNFAIKTARQII